MSIAADPRPAPPEPRECPNCVAPVLGPYCQACGQHHGGMATLRQFLAEGVEDALSLDSRLLRTLRPLFLGPGTLSVEYLAGKRARYVPPLRLYLVASLVYFGAFTLLRARYFLGFELEGFTQILPRMMLVVVPAFALLLHLLFRRERPRYLEHLVIALHYHAFAFPVLAADIVLADYLEDAGTTPVAAMAFVADLALQLWVVAYFFWMLRTVYGRSRLATATRGTALLVGYMLMVVLASVAIALVGRRYFGWYGGI